MPPFFPILRRTRLSERCNGRDPARARLAAHPGSSTLSSIRPLPPVSHQHRLAQAVANLLLRFKARYVRGVYRFDNAGVNWMGAASKPEATGGARGVDRRDNA